MNSQPATLILDDIDSNWIKLAKRLQQVSRQAGSGMAVINLTIFVCDGKPLQWTRPQLDALALLEPRGNNDVFCNLLRNNT